MLAVAVEDDQVVLTTMDCPRSDRVDDSSRRLEKELNLVGGSFDVASYGFVTVGAGCISGQFGLGRVAFDDPGVPEITSISSKDIHFHAPSSSKGEN
jgi:hypothetical protein